MCLTKFVMCAQSSSIFLTVSSHTDLYSTPSTHILCNINKWTSGAKNRNTEVDFMSQVRELMASPWTDDILANACQLERDEEEIKWDFSCGEQINEYYSAMVAWRWRRWNYPFPAQTEDTFKHLWGSMIRYLLGYSPFSMQTSWKAKTCSNNCSGLETISSSCK